MTTERLIQDQLRSAVQALLAEVAAEQAVLNSRIAELDLLIHDAEAREHRRAAFNRRDGQCYRIGAAFEPTDGLGLDPVALTGLLALGATGVLLLVQAAIASPTSLITDQLASLFRSAAGRSVRSYGVWVRWRWLEALYREETQTFLSTPAGRDPQARWRGKKPTTRQTYIVSEICSCLQIDQPGFSTRGEAFDWISSKGGNPRFHKPPPLDLTAVAEALR